MSFLAAVEEGVCRFWIWTKEKKNNPSKNGSKNLFLLIWLPFKESEQRHCIEENRNRWKNTLRNHLPSF